MSDGRGIENLTAAAWVTETLTADPTWAAASPGGLWGGPAKTGTRYPFTRFDAQSPGVELRTAGTTTIWLNQLWLIRGVAEGTSFAPLKDIASSIYRLLHGVINVQMDDGEIQYCVREDAFHLETVEGGREYRHLGGIYRIVVQG